MNATYLAPHPLPSALSRAEPAHSARRFRIGGYEIDEIALDLFNELLARLDPRHAPIDRDQMASAARDLADRREELPVSLCIYQRMRQAGAIDQMLTDPGWTPEEAVVSPARLVLDYVHAADDVIPDTLPRVGRLDDAVVVDTAWPVLAPEIRNYLDFCRLRHIEAGLGGKGEFGRPEWEQARSAEAQWIAHCRRVGGSTYLTGVVGGGFHVY